jgi:PmbA protein
MIAEIDEGFYCESMMGFGFNPANGDLSRGASGYRIENGKLTAPVSEVTLSLPMQEILTGISQIANDLRFDRSISAPHIRVDGMTIAGS